MLDAKTIAGRCLTVAAILYVSQWDTNNRLLFKSSLLDVLQLARAEGHSQGECRKLYRAAIQTRLTPTQAANKLYGLGERIITEAYERQKARDTRVVTAEECATLFKEWNPTIINRPRS